MKRILMLLFLCIGMTMVACGKKSGSTAGNPTDGPSVKSGENANDGKDNQQNTQQNNQQNNQQNSQQNSQQNNQQNVPQYERHVRTDERWSADVDFVCDYATGSSFLTADYALYHDNTGRLQIFDVASKTDIVYCFDATCDHAPAKTSRGQVIKKGCIAYTFTSGNVPVKIQGDKCYFLKDTGEVCVSDRQGENRKTICKIPSYVIPAEVFFSGDAMFITYNVPFEMIENGTGDWIMGETKDKENCGIVMVDLSDGSCTEIFRQEAYNGRISTYDVRNGHVYFQFFYLDIPFVGPNLETYGPSGAIPEGLTVENYWEEMPKHQWEDVYDYDLHTGELKPVLTEEKGGVVVFCEDFFAVAEKATGTTGLYNYNGELIRRLDVQVTMGVHTDSGLLCIVKGEDEVYKLIDEKTGQTIKQTTMPYGTMKVNVIVGGSCYGIVTGPKGLGAGYLSEADFWAGKYENAVAFDVFNETNGY